jgi:hypothetical protein
MSQAQSGGGRMVRFSLRTIALIVGLIGAILALVINILYNVFNVLGVVAGVTNDSGHFLLGLFVALVGAVGAFLAPILPIVAAIMLLAAGVAFFFAVGWWAMIASPFLLVAGIMTFSNRRVSLPGTD